MDEYQAVPKFQIQSPFQSATDKRRSTAPLLNRNHDNHVVPVDSPEHSVHSVLRCTARAITLLPKLYNVTLTHALANISERDQFLLLDGLTRAGFMPTDIALRHDTPYGTSNIFEHTLGAIEAAYTELVDVFVALSSQKDITKFTNDERTDLFNILAITTKDKSQAIETLYAALSTLNKPSTALLDYIEDTADKYHNHPQASERTARIRLIRELHAIARHCRNSYNDFISRAAPRLQTYINGRCFDMDMPAAKLQIIATENHAESTECVAWFSSPQPQDFLKPNACKILMLDARDTDSGQAPVLNYALSVLEHELVHAQSFILRCRAATSLYGATSQSPQHAWLYPPLPMTDARIKLF